MLNSRVAVTQNTLYISHGINTRIYLLQPCPYEQQQQQHISTASYLFTYLSHQHAFPEIMTVHIYRSIGKATYSFQRRTTFSRARLLFSSLHTHVLFLLYSITYHRILLPRFGGRAGWHHIHIHNNRGTPENQKEPSLYIPKNTLFTLTRTLDFFRKFSAQVTVTVVYLLRFLALLYCFIIGFSTFSSTRALLVRVLCLLLCFFFFSFRGLMVWFRLGAEHDT